MKAKFLILWPVTLVVAFGVGHRMADRSTATRLASTESFRSAFGEASELDRTHGVASFLQGLTPENLPGALEVIDEQRPWLQDTELRMIMLAWVKIDAAEMFASVQEWPERKRDLALTAAAYAWAFHDPERAFEAIEAVTIPDMERLLTDSAVAGWIVRDDREGLTEWIEAMPKGTRRQRLTGILARRLLQQGPEEMMAWADSVPEDAHDGFKETVVLKAGNALAQMDPLRAKDWIGGQLDKEYAQSVASVIVRHWGDEDSMAATIWAQTLPAGEHRDRAVSRAFRTWLLQDPDAAQTWLLANTPDPALDPALAILIQRNGREQMETALTWSDLIENDADREKVVIVMVRGWRQRDPEAADAWLAEAELSNAARNKIISRPKKASQGGAGASGRRRVRRDEGEGPGS